MVKPILSAHDDSGREILEKVCTPFKPEDNYIQVFEDLLDTAIDAAYNNPMGCVGLSANQIGATKRGFVMLWGDRFICLMNPEITKRSEQTHRRIERCLSLPQGNGTPTIRHKWVEVEWVDPLSGEVKKRKFRNLDSAVVQHEMDHHEGRLI